jgi:hypothetical protein
VQGESETFLVFFRKYVVQGELGDFLGIFGGICCAKGVRDFLGSWYFLGNMDANNFMMLFGIFACR